MPKTAVFETNVGTITAELYDQDAPGTAANFEKLANDKFYDGVKFHRVIPEFVVQGGDPLSRLRSGLTNRGLIRVTPDRVLVWNDIQKQETTELHEVPAERVVITGAPRFDEFFAMQPSGGRQCAAHRPAFVPRPPCIHPRR